MPPTDRALRRCYFRRITVEGDVKRETSHQPSIYDLSPRKKDILPINPHFHKRTRVDDSPRRQRQLHSPRHSPRTETRSSRRIRWSESGDSIRTFSPERERISPPRRSYSEDLNHTPVAEVHRLSSKPKKRTKKTKKTSRSRDREESARRDEEKRRREEEERLRKERRALEADRRQRLEEEERRRRREKSAQQRKEEQRRAEKIRKQQESRWRQEKARESETRKKVQPIRRSTSTSSLNKNKKWAAPRKGAVKKAQQPRWNYVGDPTKKAFTAKHHNFPSDFNFYK